MLDQLRDTWETLEPKAKRFVVLGGAIVLFILIIVMTGDDEKPDTGPRVNPNELEVTNILTDSDPRALGIDALSSQVKRLMGENENFRNELKEMESNIEREQERAVRNMAKDYNEAVKKVDRLNDELSRMQSLKSEVKLLKDKLSKQEAELRAAKENMNNQPPVVVQGPQSQPAPAPAPEPSPSQGNLEKTREAISVFSGEPESDAASFSERTLGTSTGDPDSRGATGIRMISAATSQAPITGVEEEQEEEIPDLILPAGAILSGVLINGMDAPTSINSKADPYPTLIRIKHEAVLPNYFRADVRECMMIGATHGSLSDERAYTRLENITCIFSNGDVVETSIDGYAVGEDGKLGMRGRVISKNGVILARALTAGFLEGISEAFTGARIPVISDQATAKQQIQSLVSSESLQSAGLEGAGKAMDRLADFYIELASGIYPVIEIDAGRQIEFVITRGTKLKDSRG